VRRNGYSEQSLIISIDEEGIFDVNVIPSGNIAEWISFDSRKMEVSKNQPLELKIVVEPSKSASNGFHEGTLIVTLTNRNAPIVNPEKEDFYTIEIYVDITDSIIKQAKVSDIYVGNIKEGELINVGVDFTNEGNVEVKPKVILKILDKYDNVLQTLDEEYINIMPSKKESFELSFENKLNADQYWANVKVYIDDNLLREEKLSFDILKEGERIKEGVLTTILNKEKVHINSELKIDAYFRNDGDEGVLAKFYADVYRNDRFVTSLESDEKLVNAKSENSFTVSFEPNQLGLYTIKGYIEYAGKRTDKMESVVESVPKSEPIEEVPLSANPVLAIVLMVLAVIAFIRVKQIKKYKK
jgi:hypothetical protein